MAFIYQLTISSGPNTGKTYLIDRSEMFIGRDTNNEIVINDPEVSRRHARVFLQGANMVIEDLGSTNGSAVSGQRLMGPYVLRPGEIITLGEHVNLLFEATNADPDATIASSSVRPPMVVPQPTPIPVAQPRYIPPAAPAPMPSYSPPSTPAPVPSYSQMPVVEESYLPEPRRFPTWAIVVIVALLFLVCICGVAFYVIDSQNLYCDLVPFLFSACQ